ncbi:uncharacterized protein LOC110719261 [Chenopodium quinoa]|uniref:uncharacterized protein LOC110719261 n=1 Tax=Chenopodium quinoa TaxID=63459 RepID=UPI000B772A36|nr:uncharacterized protein LOC110719261 [Chenopodium quinoa]
MNVIRVCVDQLAVLGDPCKPDDLIEKVLEGLQDPEYQSVIDATNNRDTLISFDELHKKLLIKEVSLRNASTTSPLPISAHATTTRQSSNQSTHTPTHYRKPYNAPHPTISSRKSYSNDKPSGYKGKCQWCHTIGHSLYRCPSFHQMYPDAKPTLTPLPSSTPPPQAHVATTSPFTTPPSWLLDTGASYHVTHDLSTLSLHHPYDGTEEVVIGSPHGGTSPKGSS